MQGVIEQRDDKGISSFCDCDAGRRIRLVVGQLQYGRDFILSCCEQDSTTVPAIPLQYNDASGGPPKGNARRLKNS
jgi:hypothetical protein